MIVVMPGAANLRPLQIIYISIVLIISIRVAHAITPENRMKLTNEQLLSIDQEASEYFGKSYTELARENVTYEDQVYNALKYIRHGQIFNHMQYRYVDDQSVIKSYEGPRVNLKDCKRQMNSLYELSKILSKNHSAVPLDAINLFESSGKTPCGIMNGNFIFAGSQKGCYRSSVDVGSESVRGRYCIAHLRSRNWPEIDPFYGHRLTLRIAICLPDTCHTRAYLNDEEVRQQVDFMVKQNQAPPLNDEPFYVNYLYCLPDEDSEGRQWPIQAKLFFGILFVWVSIFIYCNWLYAQNRKRKQSNDEISSRTVEQSGQTTGLVHAQPTDDERKETKDTSSSPPIYECFSIDKNVRKIFASKNSTISKKVLEKAGDQGNLPIVNTQVFNGFKVMGTFCVVYGHSYLLMYGLLSDLRWWDNISNNWTNFFILNCLHSPNLFFIMGGCLATYLIMIRTSGKNSASFKFWLMVLFDRYVRIMPLYLATIWFAKYVAPYTNSGPGFYDYRTDPESPRYHCNNEPWLSTLTFQIARQIPDGCLPQDWYLKVDFKLFLTLPIIIYSFHKKPIAGYCFIICSILTSFHMMNVLIHQIPANITTLFKYEPHSFAVLSERLSLSYASSLSRISTYYVGVIVGHLLYLHETRKIRLPMLLKKYGVLCAVSMMTLILVGPRILSIVIREGKLGPDLPFATLLMFSLLWIFKTVGEICIGLILLMVATNHTPNWVARISDNTITNILANLSYGVYIIHLEIIMKTNFFTFESDWGLIFLTSFGYVGASYAISGITFFLFEMPIHNLIRHLSKSHRS